jgi:hypothetical protein
MASTANAAVSVVGLKALAADIKKQSDDTQSDLYKALRAAGKAAAEPVAARTRAMLPNDSGDLVGTVRASGTRTGAAVREGSNAIVYGPWIEFGGDRPVQGGSRIYTPDGRYLFPAARGMASVAAETYEREITKTFGAGRIWTNSGDDGKDVHD